jgi:universal stress protein A
MKVRPSTDSGGVAIELSPKETQMPVPSGPFKLKKILVPVDFSECSNKAVQYAEAMAKQFNAELLLLHVVEEYLPTSELVLVDTTAMLQELCDTAKRDIKKIQEQIGPGVEANIELRSGAPYNEIVRAAKQLDIDLIIMATHGRTGFVHTFMGSTTERVVRHAACPVLVVRERQRDFVPEITREHEAYATRQGGRHE